LHVALGTGPDDVDDLVHVEAARAGGHGCLRVTTRLCAATRPGWSMSGGGGKASSRPVGRSPPDYLRLDGTVGLRFSLGILCPPMWTQEATCRGWASAS